MGSFMQTIHLPKTIDNDLPVTDNCPRFGSVASYVAFLMNSRGHHGKVSMCTTTTRAYILNVMGQHAGWIACTVAFAAYKQGDIPQMILFPEIAFDEA